MSSRLVVEGAWPGNVTVTRGWARGEVRPWNDQVVSGHVRLVRGNASFLSDLTALAAHASDGIVYSPALYPTSTRIWKRVGFRIDSKLMVLERGLPERPPQPDHPVAEIVDDWDSVLAVDRAAFEGFWTMSRAGLEEAATATPQHVVLGYKVDGLIVGYAIVGAHRTASYLQRIAVDPSHAGKGIGADLLRAALDWACLKGAPSMILNVRDESAPALRLYRNHGFHDTGARLEILVHHGLN